MEGQLDKTRNRPWYLRKRLLGVVAALAFLVYSFWGTDPKAIWDAFSHMRPLYLIPVLAGIIGMPVVRSLRLKYILDLEQQVGQWRIFSIYNVGQMLNQMLPALTGQVGRVVLFSRTLSVTKTFAFTMVMLEVLFDGITLIMLIFSASSLFVLPDWMEHGESIILMTCLFLLAFFYFALHRSKGEEPPKDTWFRRRMPAKVVREWDNARKSFVSGLNMLKSAKHLIVVGILSILSWLAHALIVLFLLRAFGFEFPLWVAIVILIVNTLAVMIPLTPGNIGTFQFACILGLGFFGVSKDKALGFSILLQTAEVAPVFILGMISSFSEHVRVGEYSTPEAIAEQEKITQEVLDFGEPQPDSPPEVSTKSDNEFQIPDPNPSTDPNSGTN